MRIRFIRNDSFFGDGQIYINYTQLQDYLRELETDALGVKDLTSRERNVVKATVQSIRHTLSDTRDRSGI